jgi:hypothetical protein
VKLNAWIKTLLAIATAISLSGCSASNSPPTSSRELVLKAAEEAQQAGYATQHEAMMDGEVSFEEYEDALHQLTSCFETGGLAFSPPILSPVDGLRYLFEIQPSGLAAGAVDRVQQDCQNKYWLLISGAYASTHEQTMEEALRVSVIDCMRDAGFKVTGNERNFPALIGNPDEDDGVQRKEAANCVFERAHDLYPELTTLTLSS